MSDAVLQQGSSGDEVVELQTLLQQLNFYQGTPDGEFGPMTEAAVAAYREWRGFEYGVDADEQVRTTLAADAQQYATADAEYPSDAGSDDPYAADDEAGGDASAADPNASIRQAAIAAATGEIGLVRAKEAADTDDTGQQTRYGWERLVEYFDVAAPGIWSEDVIKYVKPGLPSWCGIFALWALKEGGASVGNWGMGTGIPGMRPVQSPQPGDIGYIEDNQHHCLIVSVDGDTVYSIDGNTIGDDTGGGEVNDRSRSRSAFAGFFTVFD